MNRMQHLHFQLLYLLQFNLALFQQQPFLPINGILEMGVLQRLFTRQSHIRRQEHTPLAML